MEREDIIIIQENSYRYARIRIFKLYYFAFSSYLLPFLFLLIFILDQLTVQKTEMWFWVFFLVSLMPCGLIGLLLSIWGLIKSFKQKSRRNKIVGIIGVLIGAGGIIAGIMGFLLLYVVLSR